MTDPVEGGWIQSYTPPKEGAYATLDEMKGSLCAERIKYFKKYKEIYFNEKFIFNQGTENILSYVCKFGGKPVRWLDVGASVTTSLWGVGVDLTNLAEIHACDIIPESLFVLSQALEQDDIPQCYHEAAAYFNVPDSHFWELKNRNWFYHIFDALKKWPQNIVDIRPDLITCIGLLGLSKDAKTYTTNLSQILQYANRPCTIVGADWVRSEVFVKETGHDNRYLHDLYTTETPFAKILAHSQIDYLANAEGVTIVGDVNYDFLYVWSVEFR